MLNMYQLETANRMAELGLLIHDLADNRDADEIAAFLKVRGVSGDPILPHCCPLATYIADSLGLKPVRVQGRLTRPVEVSATSIRCTFDRVAITIKHSPQVREFIYRFDRGDYPELFPTHPVRRKLARYTLAMGIADPELQRVPD